MVASRNCVFQALVTLVVIASLPPTARAQFVQQGGKLVGTGAASPASQGESVALSADGNTLIVGGPFDDGGYFSNAVGAAWVYTRSGGGAWSQQGGKLVGTGASGSSWQGYSVALSADGNTAIVGGTSDNSGAGAAWVYTRTGGVWRQQGGKLVGAGAVGIAGQGKSVALSADGNTAIVGGNFDNHSGLDSVGAAWVYTRSGGVWSQQGGKLVGTGAVGGAADQGQSVALSADGNTAIVGGWADNGNSGAAWVYTRSGGVWSQQGGKLVGTGAVGSSRQGYSVALSGDGNIAIVGGWGDNADTGAAWVWTRTGGVWSQQGAKLVGTGAVGSALSQGSQGTSVALSADGNTAIVGGPLDNGSAGAAWAYTRAGGMWRQLGGKLVGTGAVGSAFQGRAVALSADGSTAIVGGDADNGLGGRFDNGGTGAAWVFVLSAVPFINVLNGVVNSASFLPGIVPNSWITINGMNLSSTTDTWDKNIVNGNLPTTLDDVSVSIGGKPAYIYYISPGQINALAPDVGTGPLSVTVRNSSGTSAAVSAVSQTVSPAFFLWGTNAVATRQDFSLAVKNGTFEGVATTPAKPGDIVILWGTGFGPTNPAAPVGVQTPADKTYATSNMVSVTVGGTPVQVYGAALAPGFAGLYQVAIQIPPSAPDGDLPVVAAVGAARSPTSALITVQR